MMTFTYSAQALLEEAYELLGPFPLNSGDETNRKAELRKKISRYLLDESNPTMGSATAGRNFSATARTSGVSPTGDTDNATGNTSFCATGSGGTESDDFWLARARQLDKPLAIVGGGSGSGSFSVWLFPDGQQKKLPSGVEPVWPKEEI
jgi:hypothetical protein